MPEKFENFNHENKEEKPKKARLRWSDPGHENEWTLSFEGYDHKNFIPDHIVDKLKEGLGKDFSVSNRGSRIEILTPDTEPHYPDIVSALETTIKQAWREENWGLDVATEEEILTRHEQAQEQAETRKKEVRANLENKLKEVRRHRKENN